jgi:hypothetical protein
MGSHEMPPGGKQRNPVDRAKGADFYQVVVARWEVPPGRKQDTGTRRLGGAASPGDHTRRRARRWRPAGR